MSNFVSLKLKILKYCDGECGNNIGATWSQRIKAKRIKENSENEINKSLFWLF